jgi:cold shock CspA family protein
MKEKYHGRVVLWNDSRSFGFIEAVDVLPFGEHKIFVHHSNCIDTLFVGAYCEFEIGYPYKIGRKPQATQVTIRQNVQGLQALATGEGGAL